VILGYDATQVRAAEAPLLASGHDGELMHRAAFGLAVVVSRELRRRYGRVRGARVVALAGPGNNGGDALHALALLADRGARVLAVLADDRVHAAGLAAVRRAGGQVMTLAAARPGIERVWLGEAVAEAYAADVVLDGLLGIGALGAARGPGGEVVVLLGELLADDIDGSDRPVVVAVDVPSGIGVDDGAVHDRALGGTPQVGGVLPADVTVTFGAVKAGLLLPPAAGLAGRVETVDIGLRPALAAERPAVVRLESQDVAALWPVPPRAAQKYTRGVLGLVAGSAAYPGAGVLAAQGAVLAGAGMVRYLGPEAAARAVLAARPEVVVGEGQVQAWALGSGIGGISAQDGTAGGQAKLVRQVLARAVNHRVPAVVDAGALALLPDRLAPWVVLTPHAGELARLMTSRSLTPHGAGPDGSVTRAQIEAEPLRWARAAHEATGATVLLKGEVTVVVGAQGAVYAQDDGPAWLATAGSGDVLTGILGALLAGRADAAVEDPSLVAALAAAAALVHGRAGHRANPGGPVSALAVAAAVPAVIAELLG
jgi:hydroxyethylthiazole kinase-like uncharacterized protein yjeF